MQKEISRENEEAMIQAIIRYCDYQERCRQEVTAKLQQLGHSGADAAALLQRLQQQGYVNDERYAILFAGGRFRLKKWGRVKIKYALQQKKIAPGIISKALEAIDEQEYKATLEKLARQKWQQLSKEPPAQRRLKTIRFLAQRGFEPALAGKVVAKFGSGSSA